MHMAYLNDNGYTVLPIHDVIEYLKSGSDSLQKVVAITFDDGFYDFYSNAFPILEISIASVNMAVLIFSPFIYLTTTRCK